ncbi:effector-associated constant component EACC1 [Streptomyces sp. NPDC004126]|uniref:effector-associated constant component EACC1 n=1 Tax=Streptomyces sp. NPDC004126 TaxID=3390695 RepID=UPI003D090EC2
MEVEIVSAGPGDDAELRALRAWLRADPELREARIRLVEAEKPETMGGVLEAVHVILSDAVGVGGFAVSLATWLSTRPRARTRTLRTGGQERELPARADADQVAALLGGPGGNPGDGPGESPGGTPQDTGEGGR